VRSEALVDRAAEALCKRFYNLESVPGTGICFARAVVRDPAFDPLAERAAMEITPMAEANSLLIRCENSRSGRRASSETSE
jgi:hypothetical protein